jgi:hypothetical protein
MYEGGGASFDMLAASKDQHSPHIVQLWWCHCYPHLAISIEDAELGRMLPA